MDERIPWRYRLTAMDPRRGWRKWGLSRDIFFRGRHFVWAYLRGAGVHRHVWRNHGTLGAAGDVVLAVPTVPMWHTVRFSAGEHSEMPDLVVHTWTSPLSEQQVQAIYQDEREKFGVDPEKLEPLEVPPWERK